MYTSKIQASIDGAHARRGYRMLLNVSINLFPFFIIRCVSFSEKALVSHKKPGRTNLAYTPDVIHVTLLQPLVHDKRERVMY